MKMASVSSLVLFLLCFAAIASKEFSDGCDQYNATGTKVFVPLKHKLKPGERLTWKYNNEVKVRAKQEEVTSGKAQNIAKDGSYILQNVKKEQSGDYSCEVFDGNGHQTFTSKTHLCVLDPVSKPEVTTECKESKAIFKCVLDQQPKDVQVKWLQDGKGIRETKNPLEKKASDTKAQKFSCEVSNKVSSKTSEPSTHDCLVEILPGIPDELLGISIWFFVAGGGGIVLVLIIIVIVCCVRSKRKRSMQLEDEEELRLGWANTEQQNHHHHLPPLPDNHPTQHRHHHHHHHHEQQQPGHTGPRQSRSKQQRHQRPRAPEPSEGQPQPQPQPRRTAQAPRPAENNDDEEQPPPLPQPRKKVPRGQVV
ncbi:T-cell surface antigen CD2 isoform X2 [Kryptolebias marmoratus]|uniref:T-cell surface antigen CD2-like n=2 Tax=Kryptolebias marmoratus TaxID=37003 RepID=A0A3Q2ZHY5_KRYMA|nr:T-cell surface antigen CD2 isoform X2 [Kryptolebias marmoratus]